MPADNLALHPECCLALYHDRLVLSKWLRPYLHDVYSIDSIPVWLMLAQGLACFNLLRDKTCCPECDSEIRPVTCAFVGCAWMYDGRKMGPDGVIQCCSSDWQVHALESSRAMLAVMQHVFKH